MKRTPLLVVIVIFILGAVVLRRFHVQVSSPDPVTPETSEKQLAAPLSPEASFSEEAARPLFALPLDRAGGRVMKKPFGMLIAPATSPVQPERFSGYHTGEDFEIFPEEEDAPVAVHAICDGTIAEKRHASGYGGVLVERCKDEGRPITVIYGHLALSGVGKDTGTSLVAGETIGYLGATGSTDTDSERKHLHLGIHRGAGIDIRGYVATQGELSGWIEPYMLAYPVLMGMTDGSVLFQSVPFTSQAPSAQWGDEIFQNACEEASILMVEAWATGKSFPTKAGVESAIRKLSTLAEKLFGEGTIDTSAEDTAKLFREYAKADVSVRTAITLADIKAALAAGDLVIAPFDGRRLGNPNFTSPGPEYHMLVIVGYDPGTKKFITNDPGTRRGEGYRYDEAVLFSAIRDYDTGRHEPVPGVKKSAVIVSKP